MKQLLILLFIGSFVACQTSPNQNQSFSLEEVNEFLDQWHSAAAVGDSSGYFGKFSDQGRFLGTDPEENWSVDAFWAFSKPYFERGKAWDFKAVERNIYRSEGGETLWFDEKLDTWMGPCRGTGVLSRHEEGLKIEHYSLSILVPNSLTQKYLDLLDSSQAP